MPGRSYVYVGLSWVDVSSVVPATPKSHRYVSCSPAPASGSVAVPVNCTCSGASPVIGSALAVTSGAALFAAPLPSAVKWLRFKSPPLSPTPRA